MNNLKLEWIKKRLKLDFNLRFKLDDTQILDQNNEMVLLKIALYNNQITIEHIDCDDLSNQLLLYINMND